MRKDSKGAARGLALPKKPCPLCHGTGINLRTGERAAVRSARLRRMKRMARDEEQAVEIAALIVRGCQTEEARRKMGIGIVRAQRVRAVAVRLGLIKPRFRAAWPEASKASARQRPQAVKSEQP